MEPAQSTLKAALWMGASIASFLVMSVSGRAVTSVLDVFLAMELRSLIGLLFLLPLVFKVGGLPAMRTQRPLQHIGRNVVHFAGQYAWLLALGMIPLAQLVAIEFTTPIWGALLAAAFLGEKLDSRKIGAILLGLLGVLVVVRPGIAQADPGHLIMLAGAVGFGASVVMVKSLTRTESVVRIIFWMLVIQSVIGLIPAIQNWSNPPTELWPWILLFSFSGMSSHFCMARALGYAEATVVMPMDFLRLPLSAVIGWMIYQEQIDVFTACGAALILGGNLINIRKRTLPRPVTA